MRVISGKKAMVTGAASGIGRAIALEFAKEGADLFLVDIDAQKLAAVADEARGRGVTVITAVCDLCDPAQIAAAVDQIRGAWGQLNILVNNAGIAFYGPIQSMSPAQWDRIIGVNLLAPIRLVNQTMPLLVAADEAHIVNMCSMFGLVGWRKTAAYQTTKFGLVGYTAALRAELQRANFGVTALCPGFVQSALLDKAAISDVDGQPSVPSWISTTPEYTAVRTVRAIRRRQGLVLITPVAHFYWRLMRLAPWLVDWLVREGWRNKGKLTA
jgi:3-oxoacyl-[acyl-carrier protein] reductase